MFLLLLAVNKWHRIIIWLDSWNAYLRYWLHDNVVHNMSYTWSVHKSGFLRTSPGWWFERYLKNCNIYTIVHNAFMMLLLDSISFIFNKWHFIYFNDCVPWTMVSSWACGAAMIWTMTSIRSLEVSCSEEYGTTLG